MIHNILTWSGFYSDEALKCASSHEFWASYFILFVTAMMCICSAVHVMHPDIDDDLFDRVWYSFVSVLMFIAFVAGINPDTDPKHIMQTLLYLLALRFLVTVVQKIYRCKKQ